MIDVIVPVHYTAVTESLQCLRALADLTEFPIRFIVAARGGAREDWDRIRWFLDELRTENERHYGLMTREHGDGSMFDSVVDAYDHIKHDYVFITRPEVIMRDRNWFSKMQAPIKLAPYVGGVFLPPVPSGSSTLDPNPLPDTNSIYETMGVLTTRPHIEMTRPLIGNPTGNFETAFQRGLLQAGATRWSHPGINFRIQHAAAWPER